MISILTTTLLATAICVCPCPAETPKPLQDSKKAELYFATDLEYNVNPYLTKLVVDGEVKNVTIVDVRDAEDYAKGHIPGAINITNIKSDTKDFPGLRKDGFNYLYGYSAVCKLPQIAAQKFASLGYPVKVIQGGFNGWKDYQYPIEIVKK
jgi:rhodanese-related sulfurtransferase